MAKINHSNLCSHRSHIISAIIFIGMFISVFACIATHVSADQILQLTSDKQFEYAESLFTKKDYLSAQNEFRRFVFFFPNDGRIPEARLKIGMSYFYQKDYEKAYNQFTALLKQYGNTEIGIQSGMFISRCYLLLNDHDSAISNLYSLLEITHTDKWRDKIYYLLGWVYVESADFGNAQIAFKKIRHPENQEFKPASIVENINGWKKIPVKSPVISGVSSIIPGGGYLYCNRYQDALASFIINGICAAAAYESFHKELNVLGGIMTVVGIGFYGGNIYGGISCAHKYNKAATTHFIENLENRFNVDIMAGGNSVGVVFRIHQ